VFARVLTTHFRAWPEAVACHSDPLPEVVL
jgi:hypothetical protein